jgi:hypothetical protein
MSHFTVVCRLPGGTEDLNDALEKILQPYHEFECTGIDDEYVKDIDQTEEIRAEFDRRNAEDKKSYPTFAKFVEDYHGKTAVPYGEQPDLADKHKYGYALLDEAGEVTKVIDRTNPHKTWDWWKIGGRWSGFFPVKPESGLKGEAKLVDSYDGNIATRRRTEAAKVNYCRISDIDFDAVEQQMDESIAEFKIAWKEYLDGKEFDWHEGPREKALSIGLVSCKDGSELTKEEREEIGYKLLPWKQQRTEGVTRYDVATLVTDKQIDQLRATWCPIKGYARLDSEGWHAPGRMGWFGCSSDEPEQYKEYASSALDWYKAGNQDDIVFIVDCHI